MLGRRFGAAVVTCVLASSLVACDRPVVGGGCGGWSVVSTPNAGGGDNFLEGVAAIAPDDVWAVGQARGADGRSRTLTQHWDGTGWGVVPSPNAGTADNFLNAVAAPGAGDVWAVGSYRDAQDRARPLAMHWDGVRWSLVKSPWTGAGDTYLFAVAAPPGGEPWAVGSYNAPGVNRSVLQRWSGTGWHLVEPGGHRPEGLNAVAAPAADDVWAVGGKAGSSGAAAPLIVHWNGSSWERQPGPRGGRAGSSLSGIAAGADGNVWAVGGFRADGGDVALVLRSSGAGWGMVPREVVGRSNEDLSDVTAMPSGEVWAVGTSHDGGLDRTLIERGRNGGWTHVRSPNVAGHDNRLAAVSALPSGEVWAVGSHALRGSAERTLAVHACARE